MESKYIGIIGIDCYEILLSLAVLCCGFGEKVLIVDVSMEEEFRYLVPTPKELCMKIDKIHWMGIDFTSNLDDLKRENTKTYQRVFIYYGYYRCSEQIDKTRPDNAILVKDCDEYIVMIPYRKSVTERLYLYYHIYEQVNYILLKYTDDKLISDNQVNRMLGVKEWFKVFLIEESSSIHRLQNRYEGIVEKSILLLPTELKNYFKEQLKIWFPSLTDKQAKLLIDNLLVKRKGICYKGYNATKELISTKESSDVL